MRANLPHARTVPLMCVSFFPRDSGTFRDVSRYLDLDDPIVPTTVYVGFPTHSPSSKASRLVSTTLKNQRKYTSRFLSRGAESQRAVRRLVRADACRSKASSRETVRGVRREGGNQTKEEKKKKREGGRGNKGGNTRALKRGTKKETSGQGVTHDGKH